MKQTFYILTLTLLLLSCSGKTRKTADTKSADTLATIPSTKMRSDIYIKDKSLYDQAFIDGLSGYTGPMRLIDNYIIIDDKYTTYFPEVLPLNKAIVFKATKAENKYLLTVTRTNLTNVTYNFELTGKDNKTLGAKSGKSILVSLFFLGAEMDFDPQTGESYPASEYWDKANDCWFSIRIGYDKDKNGKLRAILIYGCEDKNKQSFILDECPTLRTE